METLVYGNFTEMAALSLVESVENSLTSHVNCKPLPERQKTRQVRVAQLPTGIQSTTVLRFYSLESSLSELLDLT